ncbi:PE-PPE domain-containing protein [Mycobacterium sp. M1]|uniref:PE-PPE domain-containing protein n=2 Tax=Mycolicibacter acidiphilus TaxID=2835306 RepID=A0ABS5RQL3_9MYCO|nr:PE-PPE domain-containing protein [Mycolicibacter acidiphilus]
MTVGALAGGCAGLMGMTAMLNAGFALGENSALIMGSAFNPTPDDTYMQKIMDGFITPEHPFEGQPTFDGYTPVSVFTPETDYGAGLTQGVADLNTAITKALADGGNAVVFGYSMSASVATQELIDLAKLPPGEAPSPDHLRFVLLEDLNGPNGGFFTRIPGSGMPAMPDDSPYHTDIYNIEYSGGSDLPQYLWNPFAVANAMAGYLDLHTAYLANFPTTTFDPAAIQDAVQLPTSAADINTDYFLIPTQDLPLLAGWRTIPGIGNAMADLIQPDLRVLVDLGYDRSGDADVVTPGTFTVPNIDWDTVMHNLELGAQQGYTAFLIDLGMSKAEMPDIYPFVPDLAGQIADPGMIGLS